MNHDAPVTPAAMQAHIAELEQQLKQASRNGRTVRI